MFIGFIIFIVILLVIVVVMSTGTGNSDNNNNNVARVKANKLNSFIGGLMRELMMDYNNNGEKYTGLDTCVFSNISGITGGEFPLDTTTTTQMCDGNITQISGKVLDGSGTYSVSCQTTGGSGRAYWVGLPYALAPKTFNSLGTNVCSFNITPPGFSSASDQEVRMVLIDTNTTSPKFAVIHKQITDAGGSLSDATKGYDSLSTAQKATLAVYSSTLSGNENFSLIP